MRHKQSKTHAFSRRRSKYDPTVEDKKHNIKPRGVK